MYQDIIDGVYVEEDNQGAFLHWINTTGTTKEVVTGRERLILFPKEEGWTYHSRPEEISVHNAKEEDAFQPESDTPTSGVHPLSIVTLLFLLVLLVGWAFSLYLQWNK